MELFTVPLNLPEDLEEKFIIFRPLLGIAFVGNNKMATLTKEILAESNNGTDQEQLSKIRPFLESIGFLEQEPPEPELKDRGQFSPTNLTLLLTNRCQMRCIYCYASGGDFLPEDLSLSTAKKAIDIVHQNAVDQKRPSFSIALHGGGEPTMLWDVLVASTEYARGKNLPAKISLTSNGVWTEKQSTWILKHIDQISLSMDGHPAVQDHNRPLANGRSSSSILAKTLRKLDENNKEYGIRMTAVAPWSDLPESVEYLYKNSKCHGIQVEPAFNLARGEHVSPDKEQADSFVAAFLDALAIAKKYKRGFRYSAARVNYPVRMFCSAPYDNLTVNPNNKVVACFEITNQDHDLASLARYGSLDETGLTLTAGSRERLLDLLDVFRNDCRDCFCHWSCAGDCFARTVRKSDAGTYYKDASRCQINQSLTKELLLRKIAEGDGVAYLFGKKKHLR